MGNTWKSVGKVKEFDEDWRVATLWMTGKDIQPGKSCNSGKVFLPPQ